MEKKIINKIGELLKERESIKKELLTSEKEGTKFRISFDLDDWNKKFQLLVESLCDELKKDF